MLLSRILNRKPRGSRVPTIPDGKRVYAIGDIHGRLDLLEELLGSIRADDASRDWAETQLIFLGDLIDRGPDSRAVVDRLLNFKKANPSTRFLKGNHEEIMLDVAAGDRQAAKLFSRVGGMETLLSYGITIEEYRSCSFDELPGLLQRSVPQEHLDFLEAFEDSIHIGNYLFVHAGIRPGVAIEQQSAKDLRWIRNVFLQAECDHGTIVVHGHSISPQPEVRANRIGIDTGAFASGRLTALGLESDRRWFLTTGS